MANRVFLGQQPGGPGPYSGKDGPMRFEVTRHPEGRLRAERTKALHLICLKAWGVFGSYPQLNYSGAIYQDFKGTHDYHRCHRSLFEPLVNGKPLGTIALGKPSLAATLISTGAITDPEPPPANYGDRLVEITGSKPLLEILEQALKQQPAGSAVEYSLLQDIISYDIPRILESSYSNAIDKAQHILKERGWVEVRANEASKLIKSSANRMNDKSKATGDDLFHDLQNDGPQSLAVEERMKEIQFDVYKNGPSRYGTLVPTYLDACLLSTKLSGNEYWNVEQIKKECDHLESLYKAR